MQVSEILAAGIVKFFAKHDITVTGDFTEEGTITLCYKIVGHKGEPEYYTPTISIPWKLFVANLIDLIGGEAVIGVELIGEAMSRAFQQAALKQTDARLEAVLNPVTQAAQTCVTEMLASQPKSVRDGKTKFSVLQFDVVASGATIVTMTAPGDQAEAV